MHSATLLPSAAEQTPPAAFGNYIEQGRRLSEAAGLNWQIDLTIQGVAVRGQAWDLRKLIKDGNPAQSKLRTFSTIPGAIEVLIREGHLPEGTTTDPQAVSPHWQQLIKACVITGLVVSGKSIAHINAICTMLRFVATVTNNKSPWQIDADEVRLCVSTAKLAQPSGQLAVVLLGFIKRVFDAFHLSEACPIYPQVANDRVRSPGNYRASKFLEKEASLGSRLQQRKADAKLPEMRAFWEFMRIIFTEKPRTFMDAIRFAQGKILAITGLRIGEISFLPVDWKRTVEYRDRNGVSAGKHGGVATALLLRTSNKMGMETDRAKPCVTIASR